MADAVYREDVHFSGRVQGVGFRYATLQVAKEFEVAGEVKNLDDGRVRLVAEGVEGEVTAFREEVAARLKPFIRDIDVESRRCEPHYRGFEITH